MAQMFPLDVLLSATQNNLASKSIKGKKIQQTDERLHTPEMNADVETLSKRTKANFPLMSLTTWSGGYGPLSRRVR